MSDRDCFRSCKYGFHGENCNFLKAAQRRVPIFGSLPRASPSVYMLARNYEKEPRDCKYGSSTSQKINRKARVRKTPARAERRATRPCVERAPRRGRLSLPPPFGSCLATSGAMDGRPGPSRPGPSRSDSPQPERHAAAGVRGTVSRAMRLRHASAMQLNASGLPWVAMKMQHFTLTFVINVASPSSRECVAPSDWSFASPQLRSHVSCGTSPPRVVSHRRHAARSAARRAAGRRQTARGGWSEPLLAWHPRAAPPR